MAAADAVPSFSSATYSPLPTTPTRAQRIHSTTLAVYSDDRDSPSPPSTPPRRSSLFFPSSPRSSRRLPTLIVIGGLTLLAYALLSKHGASSSPLYSPAARLQYNARGKIAVDFEVHDVPDEWKCNPYKEPGRLFVDLKKPVGSFRICVRPCWLRADDLPWLRTGSKPLETLRGGVRDLAVDGRSHCRAQSEERFEEGSASRTSTLARLVSAAQSYVGGSSIPLACQRYRPHAR